LINEPSIPFLSTEVTLEVKQAVVFISFLGSLECLLPLMSFTFFGGDDVVFPLVHARVYFCFQFELNKKFHSHPSISFPDHSIACIGWKKHSGFLFQVRMRKETISRLFSLETKSHQANWIQNIFLLGMRESW
jgi:hypothetical protein